MSLVCVTDQSIHVTNGWLPEYLWIFFSTYAKPKFIDYIKCLMIKSTDVNSLRLCYVCIDKKVLRSNTKFKYNSDNRLNLRGYQDFNQQN